MSRRWDNDDDLYRERLSAAAAQYRYDGDPVTALKLEMILHKLDSGRPVRVADLEAADALAAAKLDVTDEGPA